MSFPTPPTQARSSPKPGAFRIVVTSAFVRQPGFSLCLAFQLEILVAGERANTSLGRTNYFLGRPTCPTPGASSGLLGAPFSLQLLVPEQLAGAFLHATLELFATSGHLYLHNALCLCCRVSCTNGATAVSAGKSKGRPRLWAGTRPQCPTVRL